MAKAYKETIIVKPAQEAITEDVTHLQLSKEEAIALITVLDVVGGVDWSDRKYIDNIYIALDSAAVRYDENALDRNYKPVVRFKNWSEYKEAMPDAIAEKQEFKFKLGERVYIPDFAGYGYIEELPSQYSKLYIYTVRTENFILHCFSESELQHAPSNR